MKDELSPEPHIVGMSIDEGTRFRKNIARLGEERTHSLVGEDVERRVVYGGHLVLGEQMYGLEWIDEPSIVRLVKL
jgi:hypothetical protein